MPAGRGHVVKTPFKQGSFTIIGLGSQTRQPKTVLGSKGMIYLILFIVTILTMFHYIYQIVFHVHDIYHVFHVVNSYLGRDSYKYLA